MTNIRRSNAKAESGKKSSADPLVLTVERWRKFWAHVNKTSPTQCWFWMDSCNAEGYGTFGIHSRSYLAHRIAYVSTRGVIPKGMELHHSCRNRACVNPAHLEPISHHENSIRGNAGMHQRGKEFCPQGHPYSWENVVDYHDGKRRCRECERLRARNYYRENREACLRRTQEWKDRQKKGK